MDCPIMKKLLAAANPNRAGNRENKINILLLAAYFIIRIPVIYFIYIDPTTSNWQFVAAFVAMYIIISALIWHNRRDLSSFHIDRTFLVIFILFGSVFRFRILDSFTTFFLEIFLIFFILVFSIVLIRGKYQPIAFPIFSKWNGLALISGLVVRLFPFLFILNHVFDLIKAPDSASFFTMFLIELLKNFFREMGDTVIIEEPVFRGFLWGVLRKQNWSESKILLFQAFLFWISHGYYVNSPLTFWVALPLFSLWLGYLALKSKSVIPPMIAHGIFNAFLSAMRAFS
jgi:membrane protease YdiL (CAAX protease family)